MQRVTGLALGFFSLIANSGSGQQPPPGQPTQGLGADWPNWRGPNHDGLSPEKNFRTTWTQPPRVVWEFPVGAGFSSFTCVGGKAYTCGTKDKQQTAFCLDANTGKLIWAAPIEPQFRERSGGDGPRATPTIDEGRVYLFGALGRMLCLDAEKGKEIWSRQFNNRPIYGYSGSVLILGDLAIVSPGTKDGALLALDKKTGKEVWKCGKDAAGYATPHPFTFNGRQYVVNFMARFVVAADAKTGNETLRIPWDTWSGINVSAPVFHDGYLFISSGYNTGAALFKLSPQDDRLSAGQVWRSKVFRDKFQSCVLVDGILYGGDEVGFKCAEFMTGKQLWNIREMENASVLWANGYLIVLAEDGKLVIAPATPKEFMPTAQAPVLSGRCWTIPTLCKGKLYLRDFKRAVCLDLGS
jgi:outer membrane protein assembly factor BamB